MILTQNYGHKQVSLIARTASIVWERVAQTKNLAKFMLQINLSILGFF